MPNRIDNTKTASRVTFRIVTLTSFIRKDTRELKSTATHTIIANNTSGIPQKTANAIATDEPRPHSSIGR